MSIRRGRRSNAAKRRRRDRYYTPRPPEPLREPRFVAPVDKRCPYCEQEDRLTADGRPRMRGGSWPGASRRVPPSRLTGRCERCKGTGRISLPDDQRRDPYDDAAGALARLEQRRRANDRKAA
jgi:hypothetical protein